MFRPLRLAAGLSAAVALSLSLSACGGRGGKPAGDLAASKVTTIGVNSYLWRATLDTLSFMPLLQTDSNGGVIVTDWYVNPQTPTERMKVTVAILDQDLRADAIIAQFVAITGTGPSAPGGGTFERPWRIHPEHDDHACAFVLDHLHGALSVERVDDDLGGIEARLTRDAPAGVGRGARELEGLREVEGRAGADLADLVRVDLLGNRPSE